MSAKINYVHTELTFNIPLSKIKCKHLLHYSYSILFKAKVVDILLKWQNSNNNAACMPVFTWYKKKSNLSIIVFRMPYNLIINNLSTQYKEKHEKIYSYGSYCSLLKKQPMIRLIYKQNGFGASDPLRSTASPFKIGQLI